MDDELVPSPGPGTLGLGQLGAPVGPSASIPEVLYKKDRVLKNLHSLGASAPSLPPCIFWRVVILVAAGFERVHAGRSGAAARVAGGVRYHESLLCLCAAFAFSSSCPGPGISLGFAAIKVQ